MTHGLLHLMGFDHQNDADATVMERIETEIAPGTNLTFADLAKLPTAHDEFLKQPENPLS